MKMCIHSLDKRSRDSGVSCVLRCLCGLDLGSLRVLWDDYF